MSDWTGATGKEEWSLDGALPVHVGDAEDLSAL